MMILILAALLATTPQMERGTQTTGEPASSPFTLACLRGGGTTGALTVGTVYPSKVVFAASRAALVSVSLGSNPAVSQIVMTVRDPIESTLGNVALRSGQGLLVTGSRIELGSLGGTVGQSVDYCVKLIG